MNLKTFLAAVLAALILVQALALPALATNNGCTEECTYRGSGRR